MNAVYFTIHFTCLLSCLFTHFSDLITHGGLLPALVSGKVGEILQKYKETKGPQR